MDIIPGSGPPPVPSKPDTVKNINTKKRQVNYSKVQYREHQYADQSSLTPSLTHPSILSHFQRGLHHQVSWIFFLFLWNTEKKDYLIIADFDSFLGLISLHDPFNTMYYFFDYKNSRDFFEKALIIGFSFLLILCIPHTLSLSSLSLSFPSLFLSPSFWNIFKFWP